MKQARPPAERSIWTDALRQIRRDRLAMICLVVIVAYSALAALAGAGLLASDYNVPSYDEGYQPPSARHLLGTDIFGRDVLARVIHGTKIAMLIGLLTGLIAVGLGTLLGAVAGYFGGWIDELIVWFYSTVSSIPSIMLILALSFVLGKGIFAVFTAIGLTSWVGICRLVRAEFMKHKVREYVQAARAIGAGHRRLMLRHILPNVIHVSIINFTLQFVFAIKSEVIVSYLGVGVQDQPSWGIMISDAKLELSRGIWWQLTAATLAMVGIVLAFQVFGDALRDALDPRLRETGA